DLPPHRHVRRESVRALAGNARRRVTARRSMPAGERSGARAVTRIVSDVALDQLAVRRLEEAAAAAVLVLPPHDNARWELDDELLAGTEVLLCRFPPRNLDRMTGLKLVQLSTVGYEHLRRRGLADRPVRVCNARGIFDTAIGEWNLAMMVNLARDLRAMVRNQEQAVWERLDRFQQEIRGRVVGLWGYGGIGRETARLAKALGMTVHVLVRSGVGPRHDTYVQPGTGDAAGVLPDRVFTTGLELDFLAGL